MASASSSLRFVEFEHEILRFRCSLEIQNIYLRTTATLTTPATILTGRISSEEGKCLMDLFTAQADFTKSAFIIQQSPCGVGPRARPWRRSLWRRPRGIPWPQPSPPRRQPAGQEDQLPHHRGEPLLEDVLAGEDSVSQGSHLSTMILQITSANYLAP